MSSPEVSEPPNAEVKPADTLRYKIGLLRARVVDSLFDLLDRVMGLTKKEGE